MTVMAFNILIILFKPVKTLIKIKISTKIMTIKLTLLSGSLLTVRELLKN